MLSRPVSNPVFVAQMRNLIRESGLFSASREFKPTICYNEALGVAEVIVADTSYTEVQLTNKHYVAVFERNHHSRYGEEHFVGFSLWVVRGVYKTMDIEPVGKVSMRQVLKFLCSQEDDQFVKDVITDILLPMLDDHNLDEFEMRTFRIELGHSV
jgi:hypothetical protein